MDGKIGRSVGVPPGESQPGIIKPQTPVGRWALRKISQHKLPKPPPVQSEFKFNEIKVVRNDLKYSDIEIVMKPKEGFLRKLFFRICSLISWINRIFVKTFKGA